MNPAQKHLLKTWIAAILWLGIIVTESTNLASADNTGRILYPLLHFLFGVNAAHFPTWHAVIRKSGHFVGYFTLSWLLFRAWRDTFPLSGRNWSIEWARISFFMAALVACLDEWHQSLPAQPHRKTARRRPGQQRGADRTGHSISHSPKTPSRITAAAEGLLRDRQFFASFAALLCELCGLRFSND